MVWKEGSSQRGRDQRGHLRHQCLDIASGVDERCPPTLAERDQPERRDFGGRVDAAHMPGEATHHGHPPQPHRACRVSVGSSGPNKRGLDGDRAGADRVQIGHKSGQQPVGVVELVAQRPAQTQILLGVSGQHGHRAAPGQGCATARRAIRSTLAYPQVVPRSDWRST